MLNPDSLTNVFTVMIDDWTHNWYHQKTKQDRLLFLSELRSFMTARRLSEIDKDPEISTLKSKRENATARLVELERTTSSLRAELTAWNNRIAELESQAEQAEDRKLEAAREKARVQKKNRLFTQVIGQ